MKRILRFAATFAAAYLTYLLLVLPAGSQELILGVLAALVSTVILMKYLPFDTRLFNPLRIARAAVYTPYFFWKMIVANVEIALVVISPILKINPSIVKAKTDLKTDEGRLMLTSSITLTPGTLSVDIIDDNVYVHRVRTDKFSPEETKEEVLLPFEKFIKGVTE